MKRQTLYRMYAIDGTLLYVGITQRNTQRFNEHHKSKPWWPLVTQITLAHFATRDEVREAELRAIREEQPLFNIGDTPGAKGKKRRRETGPRRRQGTGTVRQLPSGRWQARQRINGEYIVAPDTFDTKEQAETWLQSQSTRQLTLP